MLENSGSETQSHVSGHRDDLIFMTAVALKPIAKGINACSVLPRLDVEHAFTNQISEDGDVVLTFLTGLIHPQRLYIGYANMVAGKIHVFSMNLHKQVSVSPIVLAMAETGCCEAMRRIIDSKSSVKPEPGLAHGTCTV